MGLNKPHSSSTTDIDKLGAINGHFSLNDIPQEERFSSRSLPIAHTTTKKRHRAVEQSEITFVLLD